jgi:hypothetical protein
VITTKARVARKPHRCDSCLDSIRVGDVYLDGRMSPRHDGIGYEEWARLQECVDCAFVYGRGLLVWVAS